MEKKVPSVIENFDSQVKKSLQHCKASSSIGVAVSGGADSISLLTALSHVVSKNACLEVVTINHNLRPQEETGGDADYVESYCASLGVPCTRYDVPRGKIITLAQEKGMGVEEAARIVRYDLFGQFCRQKKIAFLYMAHNRNDQLETVVMRFMRGGSTGSLAGIPFKRPLFDTDMKKDSECSTMIVRPLLGIPRAQIESYLAEQNISYRTDKTNFDTAMMRNCIRNKIMPLFDKEMEGWDTAVISLVQKAGDDEEAIGTLVIDALKNVDWQESFGSTAVRRRNGVMDDYDKDVQVSMDVEEFARLLPAVKSRVLYRAVGVVGADQRIPYSMIERVCRLAGQDVALRESASGIEFVVDGGRIYIQKNIKDATEVGFFVIIKQVGDYQAGHLMFSVTKDDAGQIILCENEQSCCKTNSVMLPKISFPFALRTKQPGDTIKCADGSFKQIRKVLDSWHIENPDEVSLVQELQSPQQAVVCIWGSVLGYDNWIVKE